MAENETQWQAQLDDAMKKILNREKFSYDLNGDALYQQLRDKYIQQGKMAMKDTIGRASAMTGGYGNSYAQSIGQQAYDAQLQDLNDIVPELYQLALDKYNTESGKKYTKNPETGKIEEVVEDAGIPADISKKASTFTNNDDLADWAYGMASAGAITEEQADQLITDNMDRNEKYTEQTDEQGNKTRVASYSQMMENFDAWERVTKGGVNLLGIDKDAVVRSPDGKTMTLLELKQKLIDEGMDETAAQNKIKALQQKLGISYNWLFGW